MATKNRALERKKELENRIKELQSLINKSKLGSAVNEEEREFILAKLSKDYKDSKNKIRLSMVKPADNIQDRIVQLQQELAKVETHLGTRYLTKASEVPTGYTWSFKPEPGNPNRMINPDYVRSFDPDVQKSMQPKEGSDEYIIANPQEYTSAMVRQAQRNLTRDVEVPTSDTKASDSDTTGISNRIRSTTRKLPDRYGVKQRDGSIKWDETQEAIHNKARSSNKESIGIPQNYQSDVFSIDPETGERVGVMGRSQRRNFENRIKLMAEKGTLPTGYFNPAPRAYYKKNKKDILRIGQG